MPGPQISRRKAREQVFPQPGPQLEFLSTPADIAIYGGGAGGGKTWGLLLDPLRSVSVPGFGAVLFRREATQITNEGGLWDEAVKLYPSAKGEPVKYPKLGFRFPAGAKITFGHLNEELSVLDWQGAQIPALLFDELTHFSRAQFFYMLSRNRSTCGVRPYIRATTNPDAESWVAEFLAWWIDQDTGLPIPERSGKIRWFARLDDVIVWGDSAEEVVEKTGVGPDDCKSVTFIPALVTDNRVLMAKDPGYMANLKALSRVERERLLNGNWKVKPAAGEYFRRGEVEVLDEVPSDVVKWVRAWDFAGTEPNEQTPNPDWTVGVLMGRRKSGRYVVAHVERFRRKAAKVREAVAKLASQDPKGARISIPEDPGQAGKEQAATYVSGLAGYSVARRRPSKDKVTRAEPFAAQWQAGNVDVVRGPWVDAFFNELEGFPGRGIKDDQVDAASDAFAELRPRVVSAGLHLVAGL